MAMARGSAPTLMGRPGVPVAMVIGVTVPEPPGVMAMALGSAPTLIGGPGFLVARLTGVTEAEAELTTRATCLRGRAAGRVPGAWVRSAGVAGRVVRAAGQAGADAAGPAGPAGPAWPAGLV